MKIVIYATHFSFFEQVFMSEQKEVKGALNFTLLIGWFSFPYWSTLQRAALIGSCRVLPGSHCRRGKPETIPSSSRICLNFFFSPSPDFQEDDQSFALLNTNSYQVFFSHKKTFQPQCEVGCTKEISGQAMGKFLLFKRTTFWRLCSSIHLQDFLCKNALHSKHKSNFLTSKVFFSGKGNLL